MRDLDVQSLQAAWRSAKPFAHVVIEDFLDADERAGLAAAVAAEPHWPLVDEIVTVMASKPAVAHPELRAFIESVENGGVRDAIGAIAGCDLGSLLLRSYVYMPGHWLLPHSDGREAIQRRVAFVLYLHTDGCEGGDLRLYERVDDEHGHRVASSVRPKPGMLVLFGVDDDSVHEVTELRAGARVSLAGWFYAPGVPPQAPIVDAPLPQFDVATFDAVLEAPILERAASWLDVAVQTDVPIRGRYLHADVPIDAPVVSDILTRVAERTGRALQPLAAHVESLAPGDYILAANEAARRPTRAHVTIAVDLTSDDVDGTCEMVWYGGRGPVHVSRRSFNCITVAYHAVDIGRYTRRRPSKPSPGRVASFIVYAKYHDVT